MTTASNTATPEPVAHAADVLAKQSAHVHRDGRLFGSALASESATLIDGAALHAALAARGWSALKLNGDLTERVEQPDALEAIWVISARYSQAALEAAVQAALAAQPKDLNDWLRTFTESGQGAGFELEVFAGWSAAQWLDHEFGDDDDDEAAGDVAKKVFKAFPATLRKALDRTSQVYALRSEQASEDGAAWQPALAEACDAITRALGEVTRAVELFELGGGRWGYRVS
jgi:hypothetical protein